MHLEVARDVDAPTDTVWAVVTDIEASAATLSGVTSVERLDGGDGFGVGTRWRETRTMFGKEATEEMEVVAVEPGRAYTVRAVNGSTTYTSVLTVAPTGAAACRLTMTFGAEVSGAAGRLLAATVGRAFQGATRRALERDLDDIATTAETRHRAGA